MTAPVIRAYHWPQAACVWLWLRDRWVEAAQAGIVYSLGIVDDMIFVECACAAIC